MAAGSLAAMQPFSLVIIPLFRWSQVACEVSFRKDIIIMKGLWRIGRSEGKKGKHHWHRVCTGSEERTTKYPG